MAAVTNAKRTFHTTVGAAQETSVLTAPVRQVAITNTHATQTLTVLVATDQQSSASALTRATALTATAGVNESFVINPGKREVVYKSPAARYVGLAVIASGAATPMDVHGTDFFD